MNHLNCFIGKVWDAGESPKLGSKVRNDDCRPGVNGFIRDEGTIGMLEAKDMKKPDNISPSIRAMVYQACGESKDAPATSVFTMYIDLIKKLG